MLAALMEAFSSCQRVFNSSASSFSLARVSSSLARRSPAGGVLLLLQRRALDLELHDLSLELVDLGRHRVEFHPQPRRRLVDEVDRLVRQEPVGDVAVGQGRGGDERGVLDADAVVHLVAFLESAQNGDGGLDGRLVHFHRLETALEGGVFLDVFAVLVECGRADAAQFTAGELRLEHVGGIGRALGGTGTDERVQFVDEQNDLTVAGGDLLDERLEAILEFAAVLRAGDHRAEIHRDERLVVERLRHVAADDAPGQALGDGGLADARLADEHRVVLRAAAEYLHHAADFLVAPDDGIDLALLGQGGEVAAVFFQRLELVLRVGVGDALVAAHLAKRIEQGVAPEVVLLEHAAKRRAALGQQAKQQVLGADVLVAELRRLGLGGVERLLQFGLRYRSAVLAPCTLARRPSSASRSACSLAKSTPVRWSRVGMMPSCCLARARARCSPSTCCCEC